MNYFVRWVKEWTESMSKFMSKANDQTPLEKLLKYFTLIFFLGVGVFSFYYQSKYFTTGGLSYIFYPLAVLLISLPLHILLHEMGHLLAGFLSGYQFLMFRLGNRVWIKTPTGFSKRQQHVPGILGQALMAPPPAEADRKTPVLFYHAGGLILNLLTSILFLWWAPRFTNPMLSYFFYLSGFLAFYLFLTNALPFQGADGYHLLRAYCEPESNDEIMELLHVYQQMVAGIPFASLAKRIDLTRYQDFNNPNTATFHSIQAAAYLEGLDFQKARAIYEPLWEKRDQLFVGHQMELMMSYFFTLLLTEPQHPAVSIIKETPTYQTFKKLKQSDAYRVLATEALMLEKNAPKAQQLLELGQQQIATAPTVSDEHLEKILYAYLQTQCQQILNENNA